MGNVFDAKIVDNWWPTISTQPISVHTTNSISLKSIYIIKYISPYDIMLSSFFVQIILILEGVPLHKLVPLV